jgi:hypothetical protein
MSIRSVVPGIRGVHSGIQEWGMSDSNAQPDSSHPLAAEFRFFSSMSRKESPLYAELSARVAENPFLLDLAARSSAGQPAPNLLFAAVHDQLLAGADHGLRRFYRSLGGDDPPQDAFPALLDFCRNRADVLGELIASRRVQTNEVGRSAMLLPAVTRASRLLGGRPLHLIELGASAGLHLNLDLYRFEYELPLGVEQPESPRGFEHSAPTGFEFKASDHSERTGGGRAATEWEAASNVGPRVIAVHECGDVDSPVRLRTQVLETNGSTEWLPRAVPEIADRTGVDIAVVDLDNTEELRWNEALIWPDQTDRLERFRQAVRLARARRRVRMIEGDGRAWIPQLIAKTPATAVPCVFHSHVIYQWGREERASFIDEINEWGQRRDLCHVSLEWLDDDPGPKLHLTTFIEGRRSHEHLADCHHHGRWIRWKADPSAH